jgi:hypothetical protein
MVIIKLKIHPLGPLILVKKQYIYSKYENSKYENSEKIKF